LAAIFEYSVLSEKNHYIFAEKCDIACMNSRKIDLVHRKSLRWEASSSVTFIEFQNALIFEKLDGRCINALDVIGHTIQRGNG
jgi:hypothetical protein